MNIKSLRTVAVLAVAAGLLAGCAGTNPRDPWEGFNRGMFSFNEGLDSAIFRPVAKGYEAAVPLPMRTGLSNGFANVEDISIGVNNLLQGKPDQAVTDLGRLVINSTLGILGLFDVASEMGIEKHNEDFGQTLGRWGVGTGPYLVLPILGPRDVRDAFGKAVDVKADPVARIYPVDTRNSLILTRMISDRTALLPAEKAIEEASLGDKYAYIRDAYLQRREYLVHDGKPPRPKDDF